MKTLFALLLFVSSAATFQAWAEVRETIVLPRAPTETELERYARLPGRRDFRVTLENPSATELARVARLPSADRIELRATAIPSDSSLPSWRAWAAAARGPVMFLTGAYPIARDLERLESIGLGEWSLVFGDYGSRAEMSRLNAMASRPRLVFNAGRYPQPVEQPPLLALDPGFTVEVVTNQWTRYAHMDFLNRMRNRKRLEIRDSWPSSLDLEYLAAVRDLERLVVETDFDPPGPEVWRQLANYPLTWVRTGGMPSEANLRAWDEAAALSPAPRLLVLRMERSPTDRERAKLEALRAAVEVRVEPWQAR